MLFVNKYYLVDKNFLEKMMRIWIHGAYATKSSFNYLRTQMPTDNDMYIQYDVENNLVEKIELMKKKIEKKLDDDEPIDLIGHSLGGVICVILYHLGLKNVRSITTMSAPFGGITNNSILRFWFPKSIYTEFHNLEIKYSKFLTKKIEVPYLFIVSNKGSNPLFLYKKNDGVVSVDSQKAISNVEYMEINTNHYEVLMNNVVCEEIKKFLSRQ